MSGIATAIVGSAIIGGVVASRSADKAADAQVEAASMATGTEWDMYRQSRQDQLPWLEAGEKALGTLSGAPGEDGGPGTPGMIEQGPGDFKTSEYYQQGLEEQQQAIDRYNASRGLYASGKGALDLQKNAMSNLATNRGNWVNEWLSTKLNPTQSLAGVGQTTGANMASNAMATGQSIAGNTMAAGDARASGYINQANATTGAIQSGLNAYGMYKGYQNANPTISGSNAMWPSGY